MLWQIPTYWKLWQKNLLRFESTETMSSASVVSSAVEAELEAWADEPGTLDDLVQSYNIENKIAGRTAGNTLYVVQAMKKSGRLDEAQDGQQFKLFLVHAPTIVQDCNSHIRNFWLQTSAFTFQHFFMCRIRTVTSLTFDFKSVHSVFNIIFPHSQKTVMPVNLRSLTHL